MRVKLKVPTSLKDIRLSQYQKFVKVTKDSEDDNFINRQLVSIFCNLSDELVDKMSKKAFNEIVVLLTNMLDEKPDLVSIINHNGRQYGFIPKIDTDISVGEHADIETMMGDWSKMDRVMAILYRPITVKKNDKYLIEEYTGKEEPLDLTMDIVYGSLFFFLNLLSDCLTCIQSFISQQVEQPKNKKILESNGVGITRSMDYLKEISEDLKKSLNLNYMRL
jgi:hypothetical protein